MGLPNQYSSIRLFVMPVKTGIRIFRFEDAWIPACAGLTGLASRYSNTPALQYSNLSVLPLGNRPRELQPFVFSGLVFGAARAALRIPS